MERGGAMGFGEVIDMILTLLEDYQIANIEDEELELEIAIKVNMILPRTDFEDLTFSMPDWSFSRPLTGLEVNIIAYGALMLWLSPFVNNREVLQTQLTSKEVTAFSNSNRIQQGIQLMKLAKTEFYQLLGRYDTLTVKAQIKEQLERGK